MAQASSPAVSPPTRAWAIRAAGTFLFLALLVWLDVRGALPLAQIWDTLARADFVLVGLAVLLYVPFLLVKAARWRLICSAMGMPFSTPQALRIYSIGLAAGTFTPGQAGDALKAWYLQRQGFSLGKALGSTVLDRLFDVGALALLGLLGIAVYGRHFASQAPILAAWAAFTALCVFLIAWKRSREWALNFVRQRFGRVYGRLEGGSSPQQPWSFRSATTVTTVLLTGASFGLSIFRVWLLAAALGAWLGALEVSGFVGLTTAAALVPVSVGGIGTRDAVAALAFVQLGRPAAHGIAVSILILLLNLSQAIIGWVVWLRYRPPALELERV